MAKASEKDKAVAPAAETGGQDVQKEAPARAISPLEDMDRLLENLFRRGWSRALQWDWPALRELATPLEVRMPRVDVIDRDNEIVVRAEVAGVDKKDLDISLTDDTITIKGSTSHETREEKGDYYRCEMSRGSFSRTVSLPTAVDGGKAKAAFNNGILEVTLPKLEPAKRHTIKVE